MTAPLRVGVVGAGPWARFVHAPVFANDERTVLAGVWARREPAAQELAAAHHSTAFADLDALFDVCDAVAFAVPPDVQVDLAVRAAHAGRTLLLEKPIGLDLAGAQRLADAVGEAGVGSQVVLTWRYADEVRRFLAAVAATRPVGGRGHFILGSMLGGPFATPWRLTHGPLLDLGPHVIDVLDACLGPVVGVRAHGRADRWIGLLLEHDTGLASEASLSGHVGIQPFRSGAEIYTADAVLDLDAASVALPSTFATLVGELVATAGGVPHPLDVHRGLHLQRVLSAALDDLASR